MLSLFKSSKPLIDPEARDWMFDVFEWSMEQFDRDYFFNHSRLVLPTNDYFPGRADSVQGMADLVFKQVSQYAGVSHWPTEVAPFDQCTIEAQQPVIIGAPLRLVDGQQPGIDAEAPRLRIPYNPQQVSNPEGLIASFAHVLAHYLGQFASEPPPGGADYWPHATEMIAVFLGFGLMFANSAYTFRGGCGSCYNPAANRDAYLTERQATYALGIFTTLKVIPPKQVSANLKPHLRGFYRRALREISVQKRLAAL
jgi:hypothetical protein